MASLEAVHRDGGLAALNQAVIERASVDHPMLYLFTTPEGVTVSGSIAQSPIRSFNGERTWASFTLSDKDPDGAVVRQPARGLEERLPDGWRLFVGADVGESEFYVNRILRALWAPER